MRFTRTSEPAPAQQDEAKNPSESRWRAAFRELGGLPVMLIVLIGAIYTLTAITVMEFAPSGGGWNGLYVLYAVVLPLVYVIVVLFWLRPTWKALRRSQ